MSRRQGPDPEHFSKLGEGVEAWNRWREENPEVLPDLFGAELGDAILPGINFYRTDLTGASLWRSDLRGARLCAARFRGADLDGANLAGSDLTSADLMYASAVATNFEAANCLDIRLARADLTGAFLRSARFNWANLETTQLHWVDLGEVEGLEEVQHRAPSSISFQTLTTSQGQIPEVFLKGCGLQDWQILSAKLHDPNLRPDEVIDLTYRIADMRTNSPIVPQSVFISYSNKDMDFIEKLEASFDKDGIRSWRDVKDMVAGPIETQIDRSIRLQKVVLLVISKNSIRSDWVEWEVQRARELQKDLQERSEKTVHVLCPVAIDKAWWESNPWPGRLKQQVQEYNIVDLSGWEDDEVFDAQYAKLRKGLGIFYRNEGAE